MRSTARRFPGVAALLAALLAPLLGLGALPQSCSKRATDVLYVGGPILTMDADNRVVEALLVSGDRIAAVGREAELRRAAGPTVSVVDLQGRTLMPGFIDAHGHFPGVGLYAIHANLNSPPIGRIESIEDIVSIMSARAAAAKKGQWVLGFGYDDSLLAERRHPTREDLDRASTDHPIALIHVSAHLVTVNSRALEELEIGDRTPAPAGGVIRRDGEDQRPNGVLEETAAEPVLERLTNPGAMEGLRVVRNAAEQYCRAGVTTAQNGLAGLGTIKSLKLASRLRVVPIRLVVWPSAELIDDVMEGEALPKSHDEERFRIGAVKLVADGSIQGYTGYLREPYHVVPGDDPGYRGYPRMKRAELHERVARYHKAGYQLAIHGNGDAAIDDILSALEAAFRDAPRPDSRPVIVHAQMTRDDQLDRMRGLRAIPSFFSLHTYYWGDRHREIFMGPERAARMSPAHSALERGVRFTIHTDSPVVPIEPLRLVWAAVNRWSTGGAVVGEAERITPMQALRAVTIDAAFQHFEEDLKGSLEPGKLADFVVLSDSPLADPERIHEVEVLETVVGGKTICSVGG